MNRILILFLLTFQFCSKEKDSSENEGVIMGGAESLFLLESTWTDQNGVKLPLSRLNGRPHLLAMAYTSCEYACPIILQDMRSIEKKLPDALRGKLGFVLVTFDPGRDTPEKLKAYAEEKNLTPDNWILLNGNEGDILELAMVLGVKYKKTKDGHFSHSNIINLLDGKGRLRYQQNGLNAPPEDMVKNVNVLF